MYNDNENFRLDDDDDYTSSNQNIVDIIDDNHENDTSSVSEEGLFDKTYDVSELEINKKNREGYEQLMKESSTKLDGYWDISNPFVKFLLIGLLIVIVVGSIIVFMS